MSGASRTSPPPLAGSGSGGGQVLTGTTVPTDIPAGSVYVRLDGGNAIGLWTAPGGFSGQIVVATSAPGASIAANSLYVQTTPDGATVTALYAGAA